MSDQNNPIQPPNGQPGWVPQNPIPVENGYEASLPPVQAPNGAFPPPPPVGVENSLPLAPQPPVPQPPAAPVAQPMVVPAPQPEQAQAFAYQAAPAAQPPQVGYPPAAQAPEVAWGTLTGQPVPPPRPAAQGFFMDNVAGGRFAQATFWIAILKIIAWGLLAVSLLGGIVNFFVTAFAYSGYGGANVGGGFIALLSNWVGGIVGCAFLMVVSHLADDVHKMKAGDPKQG